MSLYLYQVDAFTDRLFGGNPAAVVPLSKWLSDEVMCAIAAENNLSETAFFIPDVDSSADFHLRWFTPTVEVDLCGHATLASAFVLFTELAWQSDMLRFTTASGPLSARRWDDGMITLDFPARPGREMDVPEGLAVAIGNPIIDFRRAVMNMAVLQDESAVCAVKPDLDYIRHLEGDGLIITAAGDSCDCVSRYFAPKSGIDEDPVTGSAHCTIAPYWAEKLGKPSLTARQLSKRGGDVYCEFTEDRVLISGHACLYSIGQLAPVE
ncbi:MAG: isomerase [Rhodospirillaceae bacterium]|nr:isomerase [Rhodospirillaceae bacterium]|tara:strand:+ start:147 stop:944 length:798 start_codon:yes stop_codon:yes gene_type:complete